MRAAIVLIISVALLALQYHLGIRKKKGLGAILPVLFCVLTIWMFIVEKDVSVLAILAPTAAFVAVWIKGYANAEKEGQKGLERMKLKDL